MKNGSSEHNFSRVVTSLGWDDNKNTLCQIRYQIAVLYFLSRNTPNTLSVEAWSNMGVFVRETNF